MLLRSTVATLGVLFAVGFVCVVLVAGVLGLGGGVERLMPWGNFSAYVVGAYDYYDYDRLWLRRGRRLRRAAHHAHGVDRLLLGDLARRGGPVAPVLPATRHA